MVFSFPEVCVMCVYICIHFAVGYDFVHMELMRYAFMKLLRCIILYINFGVNIQSG